MKQVGIGRGCVRMPVTTSDGQLPGVTTSAVQHDAIPAVRYATSSSAFNVDGLVGRPNISSGGSYVVY